MKKKFILFSIASFLFSITLMDVENNKVSATPVNANDSNISNNQITDTKTSYASKCNSFTQNNNSYSKLDNLNSETDHNISDYKIITKTYTKNNINITYPQLTDIKDSNKLNSINKDLEDIALSPLKLYDLGDSESNSNPYVEVNYEIKYQGKDFISVVYTGYLNNGVSAHPTNLFYTANIDLNKGSVVRLSDYYDITKAITKIKNSDYTNISDNKELLAAQNDYIAKMEISTLEKLIKEADFYRKDGDIHPVETFSYRDGANTYISIGTIHALGDHAEFKLN